MERCCPNFGTEPPQLAQLPKVIFHGLVLEGDLEIRENPQLLAVLLAIVPQAQLQAFREVIDFAGDVAAQGKRS